jgi:hypothetical protein
MVVMRSTWPMCTLGMMREKTRAPTLTLRIQWTLQRMDENHAAPTGGTQTHAVTATVTATATRALAFHLEFT